jgi:hypothetical protein
MQCASLDSGLHFLHLRCDLCLAFVLAFGILKTLFTLFEKCFQRNDIVVSSRTIGASKFQAKKKADGQTDKKD